MRSSIALAVLFLLSACAEDKASLGVDSGPSSNTGSDAAADGARPDASLDAGRTDAARSDASAEGGSATLDRSHLRDTGTEPFDYDDRALWACRPGNEPNECDRNLDATELLADGGRQLVAHTPAADPEFDCFYIYPTVATSGGGNMTDFSDLSRVLDPLLGQGARFNRLCEVYAPLYRQVSLSVNSDGGVMRAGDNALAVRDVLDAFDHYLSKLSEGRKFVILGHSQGSTMAIELLKARIDGDAAVRERMISAVLLGAAPRVPADERVGGDFQNIPTCTTPGETGCLIAYVSYDEQAPPGANALFGRTSDAGVVPCTEPAALSGNTSGRLRGSYFARTSSNPSFQTSGLPTDITTPYLLYRELFTSTCKQPAGFSYLEVSLAKAEDDARTVPGYRNETLERGGWGLHLADYSLALEDLIEAVKLQAESAL